MKRVCLLLALMSVGPAYAGESGWIEISDFVFTPKGETKHKFSIPAGAQKRAKKYMELGEVWEGTLTVNGRGPLDQLRVFLVYENVLSLHDEGPHLDLFDWKTFVSTPLRVERIEGKNNQFALSDAHFEADAFPFAEKEELLLGVESSIRNRDDYTDKDKAIKRWQEVARKCVAPQAFPCSVSPGKIRLLFYDRRSKVAQTIAEVELILPQGC